MNHDSPVAECWVPKRPVPPPIERTVTGTLHWPPDMKRNFGQLVDDRVAGRRQEVANMISTIGRSPVTDIPSATPMNPFSQIGVFVTRPGNRSGSPSFVLKTPPSAATSSPSR